MKSNFIKSKIFILTENADGELYSIETDEYNDIVNDWYGDCKFVPANDAKVYFATYDGVPVNPYLYNDFISLIDCLRDLDINRQKQDFNGGKQMINTEIFKYESYNNYTCFDETLKMVNDLIKEKKIQKSDIIEYRTENWSEETEEGTYYHYRAIISWWE